MEFIHFIDKSTLDSVLKNGIKIYDCYHGKGILIYPDEVISFETNNQNIKLDEDEANKLSIDEKWEKIGALGLRQNGKAVCGVKIDFSISWWPLKVFVDIQDHIAYEFAKLLDEINMSGIRYLAKDSTLTQVVNKIESSRFVLEGQFSVNSETDLKVLIETFKKAGGGIWGAHSFDCMIELDIPANAIKGIIEFNKQ